MDRYVIDLTIAYAKDLKNVTLLGKNQPFAAAYVDPLYKCTTKVAMDGSNPVWNQKQRVYVPLPVLQRGDGVLTIEIYSRGAWGNKLIGTVHIPLADIVADGREECLKHVTYQVRRPSGKIHGSLTIVAKLVQEAMPEPYSYAPLEPVAKPNENAVMAYPAYGSYPATQYPPPPPLNPYAPNAYQPYPQRPLYAPIVMPPQRAGNQFGNAGLRLGAGLLGGAVGGLLLGDLVGGLAYNSGYDQGFGAGYGGDGGDWGGGDWGGGFDM